MPAVAEDWSVAAAEPHGASRDLGDRERLVRRALHLNTTVDDLEVGRVGFEHLGGQGEGLIACLLGRLQDSGTDGVDRLAAARGASVRYRIGVTADHPDAIHFDAEGIGSEQGQARVGAC